MPVDGALDCSPARSKDVGAGPTQDEGGGWARRAVAHNHNLWKRVHG